MCILVSARLQATAAPDAPAPMISTSTGSFMPVFPSLGAACPGRLLRCNAAPAPRGKPKGTAGEFALGWAVAGADLAAAYRMRSLVSSSPQASPSAAQTSPARAAPGARLRRRAMTRLHLHHSHGQDVAIAAALQSAVQKLGKAWYRRRALRVFRDVTSLSATPYLWPSIEQALFQSALPDPARFAQIWRRIGVGRQGRDRVLAQPQRPRHDPWWP